MKAEVKLPDHKPANVQLCGTKLGVIYTGSMSETHDPNFLYLGLGDGKVVRLKAEYQSVPSIKECGPDVFLPLPQGSTITLTQE